MLVAVALFPIFRPPLDGFADCIPAPAHVVMALGLNIVVGLRRSASDLHVAFYAFGALTAGWFASDTSPTQRTKGSTSVSDFVSGLPGVHLNFLLIVIIAIAVTSIAGAIIGLPTLRLRGDYIAIVTLAFGEIIGRFAQNGDEITIDDYAFSMAASRSPRSISSTCRFSASSTAATNLRPYFLDSAALVLVVPVRELPLRDSRMGRAWIALREDEVAAASMGVPLVRTKHAYAVRRRSEGSQGSSWACS